MTNELHVYFNINRQAQFGEIDTSAAKHKSRFQHRHAIAWQYNCWLTADNYLKDIHRLKKIIAREL